MQHIKAGEGIIASNQAANRDEDVFPDPDTFNMHREIDSEKNLAYGYGDHRCIAEGLARAELEAVFGELAPSPRMHPHVLTYFYSLLIPEAAEPEARSSRQPGQIF